MLSVMCAAKIDEKKSPTVAEKKKTIHSCVQREFSIFYVHL